MPQRELCRRKRMDREFQKKLLDAFMSDYQRVYLVDLVENQIYMQVNGDKANEDENPWMQAAIDPTVSFEKFIYYYSEYSVAESHRKWFEKQMSAENIRNTLLGRNAFIISCPLVSGDRRRIEVRRFDEGSGIATTALICIPYSRASDDMERYMPGDQSVIDMPQQDRAKKDMLGRQQSISTYLVDVTEYRLLRGTCHSKDIFYLMDQISLPCDYNVFLEAWLPLVVSDDLDELKMLMSREYMLRCYALGNREPWIEYMVRDKFGNEVWLNHKLLLTKNEKSGHVMCLFVVRDITDQVATSAENERRMNLIEGLTSEYSSVYFVDLVKDRYHIYRLADFIQKRFEEGFTDSFDRSMEYFLENGVYSFDKESVRQKLLREGILKNLEGRRDYSYIFRATTSGGPIYYRCKVVRIDKNEGEPTEILVGFADVNEEQENSLRQKQLLESALEQARNAGKAKTVFLSNMSHDIRTPMNAIMGFAELAKLHPDDVRTVEDSLDKILSSGEHLLQLINNILDISRIESGRMILKEEPCCLRELIDEIAGVFLPHMNARDIVFNRKIAPSVRENIFCDILKVKQLVINLLSNAVKYTPPGGRIDLIVENADAPEGYAGVYIHVKDNGIGMSREFVGRMFEPFEREERSAISQVAGSGLGMTICKGIVDEMGGTITALSEQGKGTEMIVHLEFRMQNNAVRDSMVAEFGAQEQTRYRIFARPTLEIVPKETIRILLVEDNRMNREIAGKMLVNLGYEVSMCETGDEAVEIISRAESGEYDLILMDIHMPGMNGYQATEKIRNIGGTRIWMPIVAMTADAFESDVHHALRVGMNAFISKPVNLNTLKLVIERFVGRPGGGTGR